MCGILGVVAKNPVNQLLYDGLLVLQHRGQDAAGIVTAEGATFHMHKGGGMVRDVFRTRNMRALPGNMRHRACRYPTAGSASVGRRVAAVLRQFAVRHRARPQRQSHQRRAAEAATCSARTCATSTPIPIPKCCSTCSRTNCRKRATNYKLDPATIFTAVSGVHRRCRGAYAVVAMIAGYGLLAFRDPYGIRPLVFGSIETEHGHRISGGLGERGARHAGLRARARRRAGRGDIHRRGRQFLSASSARRTRRSIPASSNTSIWRARIR